MNESIPARYFAAQPIENGAVDVAPSRTEWVGLCTAPHCTSYGISHRALVVVVDAIEGHYRREHAGETHHECALDGCITLVKRDRRFCCVQHSVRHREQS